MKLRPATHVISVLVVLICSALLLNCGSGSGSPTLTQITISPANQSIVEGAHLQLTATGTYSNGTTQALTAVVWQTSQSDVVTISSQGNVTGMGQGVAQVSAVYEGVTGTTSVAVGPPALVSIAVSPNQSSLPVGESEQLTATGTLSDGSTQNLTQSVTWSLSAAIASVSPAGATVASAVGTATISATSGSVTGTASLTVTPAVLISVSVVPATLSLPLGSGGQLPGDRNHERWNPANHKFVGDLADESISRGDGQRARLCDCSGQRCRPSVCYLSRHERSREPYGDVRFRGRPERRSGNIIPVPGERKSLQAIASMSDGTQQTVSSSATWQTSQSAVAAVNAQGFVKAAGQGAAQVSAAYQGMSASASITVGPPALVSIAVSPNQASLPIDETQQFTATGNFTDGSTQNLTQSAVWSSSGSTIASVNPTGMAVANAIGSAMISASSGNVTGTASLTVTPAAIVVLNIVPSPISILLGASIQLQAIATMSDGTTQNLTATATWSSAQPAIAIVSSSGLTTAEQVGSTTISAQSGGSTASASLTVMPLVTVTYFDTATSQQTGIDGTIRLVNPGVTRGATNGDLCAMVFVFDANQELDECCGCLISDSGLLTLSLLNDLTANTLTGNEPVAGVIEVVSSDPTQNPQCNPGSITPTGVIVGWGTSVQPGTSQVTEETLAPGALSDAEAAALVNLCGFVETLGSGRGICTCGTGD